MSLESFPKPKTLEIKNATNSIEALNVGRQPLAEVIGVIKGLQNGAVVDLFRWNSSPEEVAEVFKSFGLIVDIDTSAKENDNSTARLIVSKDQGVIDQLKNLKRGPEYMAQFEAIAGKPVDYDGEFLKDDFPGIYADLQGYKNATEEHDRK